MSSPKGSKESSSKTSNVIRVPAHDVSLVCSYIHDLNKGDDFLGKIYIPLKVWLSLDLLPAWTDLLCMCVRVAIRMCPLME